MRSGAIRLDASIPEPIRAMTTAAPATIPALEVIGLSKYHESVLEIVVGRFLIKLLSFLFSGFHFAKSKRIPAL